MQTQLIAACGLYCANCRTFKKGKCPGCAQKQNASWCKIRTCCLDKNIANCSDCEEHINPMDCAKYNNFISRTIGFITQTDRSLCIDYLRKHSADRFVEHMNEMQIMSMPSRKK